MKINSLLYRTKFVLEAEDDLFPGIDSSAFDEHSTHRDKKRTTEEEIIWLRKLLKRAQALFHSHGEASTRIEDFFEENDAHNPIGQGRSDIGYATIPWLKSKYPLAERQLAGLYYNPTSPIIDDLEKHIARYELILANLSASGKKVETIDDDLQRLTDKHWKETGGPPTTKGQNEI